MTRIPQGGVLFLDPGVMTGVARLYPDYSFWSGQMGVTDLWDWLPKTMALHHNDLLVGWEKFDITPMTYRLDGSKTAMEVIGAVRYMCHASGCDVAPESPRDARKIATNLILKALGWRAPGCVHADDAARHLFAWCLREGVLNDQLRAKVVAHLGRQDRARASADHAETVRQEG